MPGLLSELLYPWTLRACRTDHMSLPDATSRAETVAFSAPPEVSGQWTRSPTPSTTASAIAAGTSRPGTSQAHAASPVTTSKARNRSKAAVPSSPP